MVDFKKLLFRTAGLSMLIKGITGVHGVSHLEEGNKNIPPITRKTQRPEPINFEKRLDLVQKLNQKGAQLDEVQQRRDNLRAEITQEREVVDKLAGNAGFNNMNSLDVLSDQDCFLNRVTLDDAKAYSAFSSLVYNIDQQKSMTRKASKQTTKLERDFLAKLSTISLLESKEAAIKKSLFITEEYKREVENLSSVFGIKFQTRADQASPTFEEVQEAIGLKVTALRRKLKHLNAKKNIKIQNFSRPQGTSLPIILKEWTTTSRVFFIETMENFRELPAINITKQLLNSPKNTHCFLLWREQNHGLMFGAICGA